MKNGLTLLSAASICAFAWVTPAAAQTVAYGAPPAHGPVGSCQLLAGNRVCSSGPIAAYGYGYVPGGPIAAPLNAAGAIVAAPLTAAGAMAPAPIVPLTGTPAYSYKALPAHGPVGSCQLLAGNRVCTIP